MTPEQVTEIFNATRPFTYQEFGSRIAAAARAEAIGECIRACAQSHTVSHACDAIRALLNTGEKT